MPMMLGRVVVLRRCAGCSAAGLCRHQQSQRQNRRSDHDGSSALVHRILRWVAQIDPRVPHRALIRPLRPLWSAFVSGARIEQSLLRKSAARISAVKNQSDRRASHCSATVTLSARMISRSRAQHCCAAKEIGTARSTTSTWRKLTSSREWFELG